MGEEVGEVESSCASDSTCSTEVQSLRAEKQVLKGREVDKICGLCRLLDISDFEDNEKVKLYTGLSLSQCLLATFNLILPDIKLVEKL